MDLPGRPGGDADALRTGARAWDHLAWEVWHLTRPLEKRLDALLEAWSGPAADAYRARWDQVRQGLSELDHRLHTNADHLRVLAGHIEDAQSGYDHALAAAGIATVAGIGLTLFTGGLSDAAAAEADSALAATVAGMIAEFELAMARMTALIAEQAELLGALASRFAMEFAIKGPELAHGAAGGAAAGIAFSLADGERDPRNLALSGLVGGLVEGGRLGRRGSGPGTEDELPSARSLNPEDMVRLRTEAEGFDAGRAAKLAEDPGRGKAITEGSVDEAMVGLRLERQGKLRAIIRSPHPHAEFIENDGKGPTWDVKSFRSLVNNRPVFKLNKALLNIEDELAENINVILNTAYLSETDLAALRAAIEARGWSSRILYGDSS